MGSAGSATMHIFYNTHDCNSVKRMLRPLIIVEGYEEIGVVENSYQRMFQLLNDPQFGTPPTENLTDYLYPYQYDLIYIDFDDGSDWIQRNAFVVKEVIKKVNEMKAAAGSTEENVIIGVSMGGIVSKYALLEMQANGPDHDTRLFFTYDSPLRGANIPIATQLLVRFMVDNLPSYAGDDISIPSIDQVWEGLQAPVPRQLLKYHVNSFTPFLDNPVHAAFIAEMDALGGLNMRHVALSNGAGTGTIVENNIAAGQLFFELNGQRIECITFEGVVICGDINFSLRLRATPNNESATLFYGYLEKNTPVSTMWIQHTVNGTTKPYDTSPGGSTNLGVAPLGSGTGGLITLLSAAGVTTTGPGLTATHHCIIPTFSSVSATEPSNFGTPVTCGTAARCTTAETAETCPYSGLAEINQAHIFLDERIASVLIDELVTNSTPPAINPLDLSGALNTYFNVGLYIYSPIPTVTIGTSNGKLSINNSGKVAFGTGSDPNSPLNILVANTKCDAVITVENGAKLVVGADQSAKHGVLVVNPGATVHIKSGGTLQVTSGQSQLFIKHGATLILDQGAIVRLESAEANIRIEGDLVVNGDIVFTGLGYFDFDTGHKLVFGPGYNTFALSGTDKANRFVRLSTLLDIGDAHRLNWRNGLVEMVKGIYLHDGAGLDFTRMTLQGTGATTAIDAYLGGTITLDHCKVEHLDLAINGEGLHGCTINNSEFYHYNDRQVTWQNAITVTVYNSLFDGAGATHALWFENVVLVNLSSSSFSGHGAPLPGNYTESDLLGSQAAVQLFDVTACMVAYCGFSNNSVGIGATDDTRPANIFVYQSCSFIDHDAAIAVFGDATRGAVLSDCSLFSGNKSSIRGRDIALMIDSWNSKIFSIDTDTPNRFLRAFPGAGNGSGTESHVRICYDLKGVGGSNLMRNNFWGFEGSASADPTPLPLLFLQNPICSLKISVPVIDPVSSIRIPTCGVPHDPNDDELKQPGSECTLATGMSVNSPTVDEQFHLGSYMMRYDNFDAAIEVLRPIAALWQPEMGTYSSNCQQYITVSKAFIDANDANNLPRSGAAPKQAQESGSLLIIPNPTNSLAYIHLSEEEHHLNVWDAQGRLVLQTSAMGNYRLETATWVPGIYLIYSVSNNGARRTGKLVVNK